MGTEYPPVVEGVDTSPKIAKPIFKSISLAAENFFQETSLGKGGENTHEDIAAISRFYRAVSFIASPIVFNEGTQQHLVLTGRYARLIGSYLNNRGYDYNLDTLESLGLLHDLGRVFSHRRHRNDLVANLILRNAGIKQNFIDMMPDDNKWMPVVRNGQIDEDATQAKMLNISLETSQYPTRGIIGIADALAKLIDGRLIRWAEVEDYTRKVQALPNKKLMWPSEFIRQEAVTKHLQDGVDLFYRQLGTWLEKELGMGMDDLTEEMEANLRVSPLEIFVVSKEKPVLFQNIDTVVFDVGGVIIKGGSTVNNDKLILALSQSYNLSSGQRAEVAAIGNQAFPRMQTGEWTEDNLKRLLDEKFGRISGNLRSIIEVAEDFSIDPLMVTTINNLKARGVRIILATNTIEATWGLLTKVLKKGGLSVSFVQTGGNTSAGSEKLAQVEQAGFIPIFTSFDLGVRKGGDSRRTDGLTFFGILSIMTASSPNRTLVVDDRAEYYTQARQEGYRGYHFDDSWSWLLKIAGLSSV